MVTNYVNDEKDKKSQSTAVVIAICFHVALLAFAYFNVLVTTSDAIAPKFVEIVFNQEEEEIEERQAGGMGNKKDGEIPPIINTPGNMAPASAKIADKNQSTEPMKADETKRSELSEFGDVETHVVDKPKKVNERALFQSISDGKKEGNNPTNISGKGLFPGVGNATESTRTADTPIGPEHRIPVSANLSGRSAVGALPLPNYRSQNQGRVVVEIVVDQNGRVIKATAIGKGSTVQDAVLWKAAQDAALKSRFNVKKDAPITQVGTITYNFRLN